MKFDLAECKRYFKDTHRYSPHMGWAVYDSPQSLVLPSPTEYHKEELFSHAFAYDVTQWSRFLRLSKAKQKDMWRCNWNGNYISGPGLLFNETAVISKSPCEEHQNSEGRYHNERGPAILFEDGLAVWCLNGIDCGKYYVETPAEKIDPRHILSEKNVDVRAQLIRKLGIPRVVKFLNSREIDGDGNGYKLLEIPVNGIRNAKYLQMTNPSTGEIHLEGVDINCTSIGAALKWRNSEFTVVPEVIT